MAKDYEKLTLSNDFVFGKVMENKELCKKVLETLLQTRIDALDYPQREKNIRLSAEGKPIQLDIYVKDKDDTLYDAEMQNKNGKSLETIALPKRSRYYQALMDSESLRKGISYHFLSDSYVIFICTFDPFGQGKYIYTFENTCKEDQELTLNDRTVKVFFNTKSKWEDIPQNIKNLFDYIEYGIVRDELTQELDSEVRKLRNNDEWWATYMKSVTWEMDAREDGRIIGLEEGRIEGRDNLLTEQITKKLQKGKSKEQISEELETTVEEIEKVLSKNDFTYINE